MTLAASFSGGKDSVLACYLAMQYGHSIKYLLNFLSKRYDRCCFHGIQSTLMQDQANALGISIIQKKMSDDMELYEKEFKKAVKELKSEGVKGIVFGDIYLDEHKTWVERVCKECGVIAIEPLWNMDTEQVVLDLLSYGFKAIIVSCKEELGKEFVGRILDKDVINELKNRKMCVCGENGEFHTLVIDGPIFNKRIVLKVTNPLLRDGFWRHWVLDIKEYGSVEKNN